MTKFKATPDIDQDLATIIRLWSGEYCQTEITTTDPDGPVVALKWADDHHGYHQADWAEFTWQFYGDTLAEAIKNAANWCAELAIWEPCPDCDGTGQFTPSHDLAPWDCHECGGSGLAHDPEPELPTNA